MVIEAENLKTLKGGWSAEAKRCDSCKIAAAVVFCRADSAFLCLNCDSRIHGGSKLIPRHQRVWLCEVCDQAPAAVTCKADAAALCVSCDADIHSANPLARRHERVPVEPFLDSAESIVKLFPFNFQARNENGTGSPGSYDQVEGVSWLLPNPPDLNAKIVGIENKELRTGEGELFFPEIDPFLDFEYHNSMDTRFHQQNHSAENDSIVPVQSKPPPINAVIANDNCSDIDFSRAKFSSFNYPTQSLSQSVSSSSHDVGVVPDGNSISESYSFGQNSNTSTDPSVPILASTAAAANQPTQIRGMDREARVARYKEKRKSRKFEKTIRYASRKAYAETRPRIKGRFAKRAELESETDHHLPLYNSVAGVPFMEAADTQIGLVPSFH